MIGHGTRRATRLPAGRGRGWLTPGCAGLVVALALLAIDLGAARAARAAQPRRWRQVSTEGGVVVSARDIPGQAFPEFRGVLVMKADIFQLLAILDDTKRHCEWQTSCKVMRVVRHYDAFHRLIYHRLDSPWPVSDRDMVFKAGVTVDWPRRTFWSRFRAVRGAIKKKSGVVRVTKMHGFFKFELIAKDRVRATYQVFSDPGGWLPAWLVKGASEKIPRHTLRGLRAQLAKTKGWYEAFHRRYNPAFGGKIPAQFSPGGAPAAGPPHAPR